MPFISFFIKRFFDDRSLEEHRSFEIYLKLLTIEDVTKDDQKKLAKFAYKAAKHFAEAIDDETIAYEDGMAVLKWGDYEITTRLLDGTYPDYERLFPQAFERSVRFNKKAALSAIDRVMVMDIGKVILNIGTGRITFSVDSSESGAKETIEAILEGEAIDICLNPRYLTEALKHQEGETIVFSCNTPTYPIVITSDGFTQRTLMMPIQIRN